MYKSEVKKNLLPVSNNGWDEAIYDAEQLIEALRLKITNLKRGINAFKMLRDSGEPFPSEKQSEAKG